MLSILDRKKNGEALGPEDIRFWVGGIVEGRIPDYQSAALLMAIRLNGMDFDETQLLARAMLESGDRLTFDDYPLVLDKHSTGGVGDKVTLILAPIIAASGFPVAMLSGRGLGFSGGTIDKIESVEGVSCQHGQDDMNRMLHAFGWANVPASEKIAPADRILYALRDVTATVDSLPLITASIMSKKMAGGASHLCLDVKCGSAAFMTRLDDARKLASYLKAVGEKDGMSISGVISRMEEPLGMAVGNYLEMIESVAYLKSWQHTPLMTLIVDLGQSMMRMADQSLSKSDAITRMRKTIDNGSALGVLTKYLRFCGAKDKAVGHLLEATFDWQPSRHIYATDSGVLSSIDGRGLAWHCVALGAGRSKQGDAIDPDAGLLLNKQVGDEVAKGESLGRVYGTRAAEFDLSVFNACFHIEPQANPSTDLVLERF